LQGHQWTGTKAHVARNAFSTYNRKKNNHRKQQYSRQQANKRTKFLSLDPKQQKKKNLKFTFKFINSLKITPTLWLAKLL